MSAKSAHRIAVQTVELSKPLELIRDSPRKIEAYSEVRFFLTWLGIPIGSVDIRNQHQSVMATVLQDRIATHLTLEQNREAITR